MRKSSLPLLALLLICTLFLGACTPGFSSANNASGSGSGSGGSGGSGGGSGSGGGGGTADFYLATDGNDAWSGSLAAPNGSNSDGPFASVARAQQAVQGVLQNPQGRTTPIVVQIRQGAYYSSQTLTFTSADSGTSHLQVDWENYPSETPVISRCV